MRWALLALALSACAARHPVLVVVPPQETPPIANPDVVNSFESCKAVCWERGRGRVVESCETESRKKCFCAPERL